MDEERFDRVTARLATGWDRRRTVLGIVAGATGLLGLAGDTGAKTKRRKKRCKPRPLQSPCQKGKQCCTKKTGRICALTEKTSLTCAGAQRVCCLPDGATGCAVDCDCCGRGTICNPTLSECQTIM